MAVKKKKSAEEMLELASGYSIEIILSRLLLEARNYKELSRVIEIVENCESDEEATPQERAEIVRTLKGLCFMAPKELLNFAELLLEMSGGARREGSVEVKLGEAEELAK